MPARTWVSGTGNDGNACSRSSPCLTFYTALNKTAPGGEIACLDPGDYTANSGLQISTAITINCDGAIGSVTHQGVYGINVVAGAGDAVYLSGLDLQGTNGSDGIKFTSGRELHVHNCTIRGNTFTSPSGNGIYFNNTNNAKLFVTDTVISDNVGSAIQVAQQYTANASAMVSRVRAERNGGGFLGLGSGTGSIWMDIEDSVAAGNTYNGVNANGANVQIILNRVASSNNNTNGIVVNNGGTVRFGYSTITGNTTGIQNNGGTLGSYGNNLINGNTSDGATPTVIPMH